MTETQDLPELVKPELRIQVDFSKLPGFMEGSAWVDLTAGISVITGRNNVGKTRLLKGAGALGDAARELLPIPRPPLPMIQVFSNTTEMKLSSGSDGSLRLSILGFDESERIYDFRGVGSGWLQMQVHPPQTQVPIEWRSIGDEPAEFRLLNESISRIIYLPSERRIPAAFSADTVEVPSPDGQNLVNAIHWHAGNQTSEYQKIVQVMRKLYPEIVTILAAPDARGQIRLLIRDRYSGSDMPVDEVGTGVGQILHLVTMILTHPPGRIFLIDEPHAFLHPSLERLLVDFLREHREHFYTCATHSPVFVNAARPEHVWLLTRDGEGTRIKSVFAENLGRRHLWAEVGIWPGDVAFAEQILFVEGQTELLVFPIFLRRLGWNPDLYNCAIVPMTGTGVVSSLTAMIPHLNQALQTDFVICLDRDQEAKFGTYPKVRFIPYRTLEDMFLEDPEAVLGGILEDFSAETEPAPTLVHSQWTMDRAGEFIQRERSQTPCPSAPTILNRLVREIWGEGAKYDKVRCGPVIANRLRQDIVETLRPTFQDLFILEIPER